MIDVQLRKIMAEKNISATEIYEKTGVARTTVAGLTNKKSTMISFNTISKICDFLNITPNELFGYEEAKNDEPVYMDILKEISRKLDK